MENYNYVICLDLNLIYQSTERIDLVVKNLYFQLLVVSENELKDYSQINSIESHVSFVLRPMRYGVDDIKKIERVILRCVLFGLKSPSDLNRPLALLSYSGDNIYYYPLKGIEPNDGSYKDIDLGIFSRSKFRQFLFCFAGMVNDNSQIFCLDTMIERNIVILR